MAHLSSVGAAILLVAACATFAASCATPADPCTPNYTGNDACSKLSTALLAKCPSVTVDCAAFFAPTCKPANKFCSKDFDACVADINKAADCAAAQAVTCKFACF